MPPGTTRAWPPRWMPRKNPVSGQHYVAFLRQTGLIRGHDRGGNGCGQLQLAGSNEKALLSAEFRKYVQPVLRPIPHG